MLKAVLEAINRYEMIRPGDSVVAGISGGPDSVALLLQLAEYREQLDYTLQVFHLNHLIRDEAEHDEEFVRALCEKLGVPVTIAREDVKKYAADHHMSVEEAGRRIRYELMRDLGPDKIAVGHHRDDVTETVLINMCRGTGLHGMVGIAPVQDDVIRPLINLTKEEIKDYLDGIGQDYCMDITNESVDYTRNKLRHEIIPALTESVNEQTSAHIAAMAGDMLEIERYIGLRTDEAFFKTVNKDTGEKIEISLSSFNSLDNVIAKEVLLKSLERLTPHRKDITRVHIDNIIKLCRSDGEKQIDMPYGIRVSKNYDNLLIERTDEQDEDDTDKEEFCCKIPMLTEGEGWTMDLDDDHHMIMRVRRYRTDADIPSDPYTKWFDYDKIDWSKLYIRHRRPGDHLTINKEMAKKSLQDYMVDEKIQRSERDDVYLLAEGSHILWVIGHRISEYYKLTEDSKRILEINII